MLRDVLLAVMALGCAVAAAVWGRSALRLSRAARRIEAELGTDAGAAAVPAQLAWSSFRREVHNTVLYAVLAVAGLVAAVGRARVLDLAFLLVLGPAIVSMAWGRRFLSEAGEVESQARLERRAREVIEQERRAPIAWADRLAPEALPHIAGFDIGRVYLSEEGAMAGDFYDIHATDGGRMAAVIGDVAGHGIEASITAFQVKYLLRVFLRQFRDPAQALEELNKLMSAHGRPEDLVSLCVVVFDTVAGTMRYASAGHPATWLWHDGEVSPLRATGPLLTLDPVGTFTSREISLETGDLVLMYTDGLAEARAGDQLFGEDRIANILRRDPGEDVSTLCKTLLEAARDFSSGPLADDIAILAVRRT